MSDSSKTVLFLLRNLYYLRNFEAPIRALADRGHRIVILADPEKTLPAEIRQQASALQSDFETEIRFGDSHGRRDFRHRLADDIHTARDILRFYAPAFRKAGKLRKRAAAKATPLARWIYNRSTYWDAERNSGADERLARWDESLPIDRVIAERIARIKPDLLVVTPLVDLRTDQIDWVRASRAAGIPTILAVASWDNLTSKSRIQAPVDRVLVWNATQRREAVDLHDIVDDSIVVTGAQLYDDWFTFAPSMDRQEYCKLFGFDPKRRIILYAGSSASIAPDEPDFIRKWLRAIRSAGSHSLADSNIIIRPHPMNFAGYDERKFSSFGPVSVSPRNGGLPVTRAARIAYYDALHHCDLIVGLNTSALVEAAILGKTCHTIADPMHHAGQHETLHYHYLTAARILRESRDLPTHIADLTSALGSPPDREAADAFVAEFIRPHGREVAATPIFLNAVESALRMTVPRTERNVPIATRILMDAAALASLVVFGGWQAARRAFGLIRRQFTELAARRSRGVAGVGK